MGLFRRKGRKKREVFFFEKRTKKLLSALEQQSAGDAVHSNG
jgi:hypothetical protein